MKRTLILVLLLVFSIAGVFANGTGESGKSGKSDAEKEAAYKNEYKMSLVVGPTFIWGKAAIGFAKEVAEKTDGRVNIKNYFGGQLFAGQQTNEFMLLVQGVADFAFGSTINWSPQAAELNLFSLPFMFPSYKALDAVKAGSPGQSIFNSLGKKGVKCLAWGENGFREVSNNKRAVLKPEDLNGLKIRIVGSPIFIDLFRAFGADPMAINWSEAVTGFQQGTVDGQENPIVGVQIPVKIWQYHKYETAWHATIDPLILGVSSTVWDSFSARDQKVIAAAAKTWGAWETENVRKGLTADDNSAFKKLEKNGMEVTILTPEQRQKFAKMTKSIVVKWTDKIGADLVKDTQDIVSNYSYK